MEKSEYRKIGRKFKNARIFLDLLYFATSLISINFQVSLSDSRNQLKFKIKGPFRDENYSAVSAVLPSIPPPVQPAPAEQPQLTGTLRRMRKKELLRQYWTQDMNMHEGPAPAAPQAPPPSRTAITIPKAVASMTTIPTREDYRALIDANSDKKRNKNRGKDEDDEEDAATATAAGNASVRRGNKVQPPTQVPTKLKIKIGDIPQIDVEKKNLRVRPPKKRPTPVPNVMPTVDELRRESMKYRRKIMADFDGDNKNHEHERNKSKSKKKKRKSWDDEAPPTGRPRKIVIRFGGSDCMTVNPTPRTQHETDGRTEAPPPSQPPPDPPPDSGGVSANPSDGPISDVPSDSKARTSKSSPIRLKFARSEEGSYVMAQGTDKPAECPPVPVRWSHN